MFEPESYVWCIWIFFLSFLGWHLNLRKYSTSFWLHPEEIEIKFSNLHYQLIHRTCSSVLRDQQWQSTLIVCCVHCEKNKRIILIASDWIMMTLVNKNRLICLILARQNSGNHWIHSTVHESLHCAVDLVAWGRKDYFSSAVLLQQSCMVAQRGSAARQSVVMLFCYGLGCYSNCGVLVYWEQCVFSFCRELHIGPTAMNTGEYVANSAFALCSLLAETVLLIGRKWQMATGRPKPQGQVALDYLLGVSGAGCTLFHHLSNLQCCVLAMYRRNLKMVQRLHSLLSWTWARENKKIGRVEWVSSTKSTAARRWELLPISLEGSA